MPISICGSIERVIFQSPETGYAILKVSLRNGSKAIVVGTMFGPKEGIDIECVGDWSCDSRYGKQFKATEMSPVIPVTIKGIENYLASGIIRGIGPAVAKKIVKRFGFESIEIIEKSPQRLKEVSGIGKRTLENIVRDWEASAQFKSVMMFLKEYNISNAYATKIHNQYGSRTVEILRSNPYVLAEDIKGIGFRLADAIAMKIGISKDSRVRVKAGILYALEQSTTSGHVYLATEELVSQSASLLDVDKSIISEEVSNLFAAEKIIIEDDCVFLPVYYYSELGIAKRIAKIKSQSGIFCPRTKISLNKISKTTKTDYDETQAEAIRMAVNSKFMVLTGGPGTGKTTTTNGIIAALKASQRRVLLAAPTGRAAKRLSEITGQKAKTIHRLLEYNPLSGYARNEDRPLTGDTLIIDECSMIDTILMFTLLKAVPEGMSIILVGDVDQLPSVGTGNILRDIIESGSVDVIRLTKIFRQAMTSRIITNAHLINQGEYPQINNSSTSDFFFIERDKKEDVGQEIIDLVTHRLPLAYGVNFTDIQVLTPMVKGELGTKTLNMQLQGILNPEGFFVKHGDYIYRKGDKVMQITNNYDKGVFNGDIGFVTSVDMTNQRIRVNFDNHNVEYSSSELEDLVLAYATTVHKSQGSEYPIVVIPVHNTHHIMLQRNLIYTGITRAKKICVLVGSKQALAYAVKNQPSHSRNTKLKSRLIEIA